MSTYGQYDVPKVDEMVNFGVGQPNNDFLPLDLIKKGMNDFLINEQNKSIIQYGVKSGYQSFRNDLAGFIEKQIDTPVDPNELFVTNGVTGALNLICSVFGNPGYPNRKSNGTIVIVEDPTYFLALNIFKDYNYYIEKININDTYVEQVENIIKKYSTKYYNIILYTIPTFQNPTNYTMPDHTRKELVELTHKYPEFLIIADEVYQFLYFDKSNKPPLPLHYYNGNVLSIGSFSKILCPGIRLGWIQANKNLIKKLDDSGTMESGGALNVFGCRIVQPLLLNNDLHSYLEMCRNFLKTRGEYMYEQLKIHLSQYCEFYKPTGGYFIWIKMKDNKINTKKMLDLAINNKVRYHFGEKFSNDIEANNYFRLSFSWYCPEDIKEGILRLKKTIEEYYQTI